MSSKFAGVTFDEQAATPSDDAIIRRAVLDDGVLTGCEFSYTGSTLTMTAGQLMICGRQIKHPSTQNWAVADATSGFARLLLTIDLTRTASKDTFEQVVDTVEYASALDGFADLVQDDINVSGTRYQLAACVVALASGGISGIVSQLGQTGGGTGGTLTVTTPGAGITVTAAKDGKTKTKVSGADGTAVFKGLEGGDWAIAITDGSQTAQKTAIVTTDYAVALTFFAATINVTYPAGSVCTATDGVTTLAAPDTSGSWSCVVPNAGTWTVKISSGTDTTYGDPVAITTDGQTERIKLRHGMMLYMLGAEYTAITGGWGPGGSTSSAPAYKTGGSTINEAGELKIDGASSANSESNSFVTLNKVDVTNIDKIFFNVTDADTTSALVTFACCNGRDYISSNAVSKLEKGDTTITGECKLDVSGLTGAYYIGFGIRSSGGTGNRHVHVSEIWGE